MIWKCFEWNDVFRRAGSDQYTFYSTINFYYIMSISNHYLLANIRYKTDIRKKSTNSTLSKYYPKLSCADRGNILCASPLKAQPQILQIFQLSRIRRRLPWFSDRNLRLREGSWFAKGYRVTVPRNRNQRQLLYRLQRPKV